MSKAPVDVLSSGVFAFGQSMKAIIDIGSNSVLLLVGERNAAGQVQVVRDEARTTRLSEGVAAAGVLSDVAIERTVQVLAEYRVLAGDVPLTAVATEGLRLATNQDAFVERAQRVLGSPVQLISGDEEARLSYLSVAREQPDVGELRVLDIGGASTELAVGNGDVPHSLMSHKIGSVRLTERFVVSDPPLASELQAVADAAMQAFTAQPVAPHPVLHGLAGTVTTAAALLLGLARYDRERIDGSKFTAAQILDLRNELTHETLEKRSMRPCLPSGRADVIVAGLTILVEAMTHCGAEELVVRDRGLRYALV